MFSNSFGFKEEPFSLDLELKFLYKSPGRESTDRQISEQIRAGKGVVLLTGETGSGKTLALFDIANRLGSDVKFVHYQSDRHNFSDLIGSLCNSLALDTKGKTIAEAIQSLEKFLSGNKETYPRIALIVDDAHKIQDDVFNKLLLLSIPPSNQNASLQIILAGSPGLRRRINQIEATLRNQVKICKYRLEKLNAAEVEGYINQRIKIVGGGGRGKLFTSEAVSSIAKHSDGIPRLINKICSSALFAADNEGKQKINEDLVEKIAKDWLLLSGNSGPDEVNPSHSATESVTLSAPQNMTKYVGWGLAALLVLGLGMVGLESSKLGSLIGDDAITTAILEESESSRKKTGLPQQINQGEKRPLEKIKTAASKGFKTPASGDESVGSNTVAAGVSDQAMLLPPDPERAKRLVKTVAKNSSVSGKGDNRKSKTQAPKPKAMQPGEAARQFIGNQEDSGEAIDLDKFYDKAEKLSKQGQSMDAYLLYFYAAKRGHGNSAFKLALIADPATFKADLSITGKPNLVQAKKWYEQAALAGHPSAKRSIEQFRTQVSAQAAQGDDQAQEMMILLQ